MNVFLGLDTSCYTTSAALVDEGGAVISDARSPLEVAAGARGMRQSDMVFKHNGALPALAERVFSEMRAALGRGARVAAVAASTRPRDAEGSYMPAFTVGEGYGRALAAALGAPFYQTSHQWGHVKAGLQSAPLCGAFHALHVSGGTTELLRIEGDAITLLGGTQDISAGQLVDRIGVMLGTAFPAGPHLETLALGAALAEGSIKPVVKDMQCSLSGAEAELKRRHGQGAQAANIALQVYHVVAATLAGLIKAGHVKGDVLFIGGVASSALLRRLLDNYLPDSVTPHYAAAALSGDNAVGVALIAREKYWVTSN